MSAHLAPSGLRTRWLAQSVETHDVLDSTNARAWAWSDEGAPHGALVVTARQTAGRGRHGRAWSSPAGNLYASIVLRPDAGTTVDAGLALVVGLEIARTLREDLGIRGVGVKWPNDVWIDGLKVAGVLVEGRLDPPPRLIVGFGVNLRRPPDGWGELEGRATAIDAAGPTLAPADFLVGLLPRLESGVDAFLREGFAGRRAAWKDFDVLAGRAIRYQADGRTHEGRAEGVADDGSLRVHDGDAVRTVRGGEVHIVGVTP